MIRTILVLLLLSTLFISGCECVSGFGRDLQKAGSWLERNTS
jgi:predicted small secreted protein